jgi:transcriptional regulator NrdR family protein
MKKKTNKKRKMGKIAKKAKKETELHIVKRRGHKEIYDEKKVYGSCYFACRSSHMGEQEAEKICSSVTKSINKWVMKRKMVTSDEIFRNLVFALKKHNEDAAFMYETHRDIS